MRRIGGSTRELVKRPQRPAQSVPWNALRAERTNIYGQVYPALYDDDAAGVAAIYDPIVAHTAISFEEFPPGPAEMRRRIADAGDMYPWLVCERGGRVSGYVYASAHRARAAYRWSVDVSAYVAPEARRLGIARRLYQVLLPILEAQGYGSAFAGIALPNEPSCELHARLGFTPVGVYHAVGFKCGAWHDVGWYERRLRTGDEAPAEPRPLSALPPRVFAEVAETG